MKANNLEHIPHPAPVEGEVYFPQAKNVINSSILALVVSCLDSIHQMHLRILRTSNYGLGLYHT